MSKDPQKKLAAFGAKVFLSSRSRDGAGCDVDGGDVQDWALAAGLLEEREVKEACSPEDCICAEVSDFPTTCYFMPADVQAYLNPEAVPVEKPPRQVMPHMPGDASSGFVCSLCGELGHTVIECWPDKICSACGHTKHMHSFPTITGVKGDCMMPEDSVEGDCMMGADSVDYCDCEGFEAVPSDD